MEAKRVMPQPMTGEILEALLDFRDAVSMRFDAVDRTLQDHSRILNDHSQILREHSRKLDRHDRRFDSVDFQLREIRDRVAVLEHR